MESLARRAQASEARRATLVIGVVYGLVGTLWVGLSDWAVARMSTDVQWLVAAHRFKGMVFVGLTTLGAMALAHIGFRRLLAMQQRVIDSDLRVRDLFLQHPQPMWVFDPHSFEMLRVNDAALRRYGYTREEFLALSAKDLRPEADVPAFVAAVQARLQSQQPSGLARHRVKAGDLIHVRISAHVIELKGRPAMMVMAEDATREVALRATMHRQQHQFRQLHESLDEVLWIASPDGGSLEYVSPAFKKVYGREPSELLANPGLWRQAVHPDDEGAVVDIRHLGSATDSVACEYRIVHPDGSVRWIRDRKRIIRDEAGTPLMVGGIAADITVWKERDEARAALTQRLETLVAERTRELEQANIELEAFTRTAAHDLKNPLNGIVGLTYLLRRRAEPVLDPTSVGYLDRVQRSAGDMVTLINDLLALSRAGSVALQRRVVDLAPRLRRVFDDLQMLEPMRHVELQLPERLELEGDESLLHSVLQNLATNAWKFTAGREPARVQVSVVYERDQAILTVSDNGSGFEAPAPGELLHPFQRFHTQAQFPGTGLGLVTCQRIVQRHGGRLELASTPGEGTQVTVRLPWSGLKAGD